MAERRVLVCDNCHGDSAVRWYVHQVGRPTREVDLCEGCSGLLESLSKKGRPSNPRKKTTHRKFQKVAIREET